MGTGSTVVSLVAIYHSISLESQTESLDTALTSVMRCNLIQQIIKVVTVPWPVLEFGKEALKISASDKNRCGRAGNATVDILNRPFMWLLHLLFH